MPMVVYDHIGEKITKDLDETHFLVTDNITKYVEPVDVGSVECTNKERVLAAKITGLPDLGGRMRFYGAFAQHIVGNWNGLPIVHKLKVASR